MFVFLVLGSWRPLRDKTKKNGENGKKTPSSDTHDERSPVMTGIMKTQVKTISLKSHRNKEGESTHHDGQTDDLADARHSPRLRILLKKS